MKADSVQGLLHITIPPLYWIMYPKSSLPEGQPKLQYIAFFPSLFHKEKACYGCNLLLLTEKGILNHSVDLVLKVSFSLISGETVKQTWLCFRASISYPVGKNCMLGILS